MIECFHRSLKSSLQARPAGSDWVAHLPLVMLGLRSPPKDDSGPSPAEAVKSFFRRIEQAVLGFSGPPQHHVIPQPLPRALQDADFVFVHDDASKPPISSL